MRRRTVLAGAVTPLVLVLAGCGSDNPKPSPPASSSASPSASPSVVAPTMPAEAKGTGPEAAKAFVKPILDVQLCRRTGDAEAFRAALYHPVVEPALESPTLSTRHMQTAARYAVLDGMPSRFAQEPSESKRIKVDALVRVAEQE